MKNKKTKEQVMRQMALVDWVKTAMFDAMQIWINGHQEELSELITEALSDRIEISFTPRLKVKENDKTTNGE